MDYYIGLDLGTSSLKGLLVDENGKIIKEKSINYPVYYPENGWSEQKPEDWLNATKEILEVLSSGISEKIKGISFSGQMHGLVMLDDNDNVIRPCILWNDGRAKLQTDYLNNMIGKDKISSYTANIAFAGFTAPKIIWVKENEPENFKRIAKIMLPKDYLAYKLTGVFSTDYSDASGTLLLDVKNKCWSEQMCDICGVKKEWLPKLYESFEITGKVKKEYNLPNAMVSAGAGDNAASAYGMGVINDWQCNISLGTSGTLFIATDKFMVDKYNSLHSFCHANGKWHVMGCILSAASSRKWWLEDIIGTKDYKEDENNIQNISTEELLFAPFLMGERCPYNDTDVRGAFFGLSANTSRAQLSKAIMEGVAFALKDCLEIARENNCHPNKVSLCGGGSKSKVWRQIIADVLNVPIIVLKTEQGGGYGAALLAMRGLEKTTHIALEYDIINPNIEQVSFYETKYKKYKKLYPFLRILAEK